VEYTLSFMIGNNELPSAAKFLIMPTDLETVQKEPQKQYPIICYINLSSK
jgi:hypothetical protein